MCHRPTLFLTGTSLQRAEGCRPISITTQELILDAVQNGLFFQKI